MSYRSYFYRRPIAESRHLHAYGVLQKTSSGALRTFKRFAASCYSGVPEFRPDPAQTVRTNDSQVFRFRRVA